MVGDVLDLGRLVVVRQDDDVLLAGEPAHLVAPVLPLVGGPAGCGGGGERRGHGDLHASGFLTIRRKPRGKTIAFPAWVPCGRRRSARPIRTRRWPWCCRSGRAAARHALAAGERPFAGAWALPGARCCPTRPSAPRSPVSWREGGGLAPGPPRAAGDPQRSRPRPPRADGGHRLPGAHPGHVDPALPDDTAWHPVDALPTTAFDHGSIVRSALARLRSKLSYTNVGFALAPPEFTVAELRELYVAALGYDVTATNLQRVLLRRGCWSRRGSRRRRAGRAAVRPRSTGSGRRSCRSPTRSRCSVPVAEAGGAG